jgi:hypothetical protein
MGLGMVHLELDLNMDWGELGYGVGAACATLILAIPMGEVIAMMWRHFIAGFVAGMSKQWHEELPKTYRNYSTG